MMTRLAVLAAMLLAVLSAAGCSDSSTPIAPTTVSQTAMPTAATTALPSPTATPGCVGRSGDNGYPVDIGSPPAFCVTWAAANGASGYRVRLNRAAGQFEYRVAAGQLELIPTPGEGPEYQGPREIRCFNETALRVTVFARSQAGEELLGGVDVIDGCTARQFTASGCVAPERSDGVSWLKVDLDKPGSFEPWGCIAWIDRASGERGFRVEILYSGGDHLRYDVPANSHEMNVPLTDRPPADLAEAFRVHRKDFTIQVAAVYDDRVEHFAATSVIVN